MTVERQERILGHVLRELVIAKHSRGEGLERVGVLVNRPVECDG
jgi:hypothetical protein